MDPATDITQLRDQYTYYSKRLLSDLGLGEIGQPERSQLLAGIENYVQQVMINCLLENMTEEGVDEAEKALESGGSQEEAIAIIAASIPNAEVIIADALIRTYAEMLNDCRQLAAAIAKKPANSTTALESSSGETSPLPPTPPTTEN